MKGLGILTTVLNFVADWIEDGEYDRTSINEDGQVFYGLDNGDGTTVWYDENGREDCTTDTPYDEDDEY